MALVNLIQISDKTLINPEYISHITVRKEAPPNPTSKFAHEYPVYRITMYDGNWYDVAFINDMPNEAYPFESLQHVMKRMTGQ